MVRALGVAIVVALYSVTAYSHEVSNPVMSLGQTSEGHSEVYPQEGTAGQYGSWTVTYTIGKSGIATGGGIRVQLPDEWHSGQRNSANRLQTKEPQGNHYITGRSSRHDVKTKTIVESEADDILIKHEKVSLDGRTERYVFVVRVLLVEGELREGDTLSVTYGDRSGGSAGYRASAISTRPLPILIAVDNDGDGQFMRLKDTPEITARPGSANEIWMTLPSQAVIGRSVQGLIAVVDQYSNAVDHAVELQLAQHSGVAEFPSELLIDPATGFVRFDITAQESGVVRLRVRVGDLELEAVSNPMRVTETESQANIYWGDLHSHSHFSWDGVGQQNFEYARNIAGLDFYAMADHSFFPESPTLLRGLSDATWDQYVALAEEHNDPPRFVTIQAYECSFGAPYGHQNVYFRDKPGILEFPGRTSLPELWERLQEGDALTVPHHTGKFPKDLDFSIQNEELRRNFELYSGHGLSETYNPSHPLAFEQSLFTWDSKSLKQPSNLQDAWTAGQILSTIASSDEHFSHPGQPQYGLAAVRVPDLTRNSVFQGLYDRHTYATTGARIILDFSIDGTQMGQTVSVKTQPNISIAVIGTDEIDWVELLRYQDGDGSFQVIRRWQPDAWEFSVSLEDRDFKPGAMYYTRMKQKHRIRNRAVMAWSSPIWTTE